MGRLLGNPKTVASAQVRLMVPIAIVSAFLNNTPVAGPGAYCPPRRQTSRLTARFC
jgi:hypothetical protein